MTRLSTENCPVFENQLKKKRKKGKYPRVRNNTALVKSSAQPPEASNGDIIYNVLLKVPPESLFRFRTVCKSWSHLISDPNFANLHVAQNSRPHIIFTSSKFVKRRKQYVHFSIDIHEKGMREKIFQLPLEDCSHDHILLASCNGLLLLGSRTNYKQFFVCNPVTGQYCKIPPPPSDLCSEGLALVHDASIKKYKVFGLHDFSCSVLTLNDKDGMTPWAWRKLDTPMMLPFRWTIQKPCLIFLNNELHLLTHYSKDASEQWSIYSMDVAKEDFRETRGPSGLCEGHRDSFFHSHSLLEMKGSLCITSYNHRQIDIWVLEDMVNCLWTKKYSISVGFVLHKSFKSELYIYWSAALLKIVIQYQNHLLFFDLNSRALKHILFKSSGIRNSILPCPFLHVNSLVSWE